MNPPRFKKKYFNFPRKLRFLTVLTLAFLLGVSSLMGCGEENFNQGSGLRILGTVKDLSGNPIEGASVLLLGTGIPAVMTDVDGEFRIENVPAGTYNIEVTKSGYKNVLEIIVVDPNDQPTLSNITMEME